MKQILTIAAASPTIRLCDAKENAEILLTEAKSAVSRGTRLLVLPHLSLTGVTLGDLRYQAALLDAAKAALLFYARETAAFPLLSLVGLPIASNGAVTDAVYAVENGSCTLLLADAPFVDCDGARVAVARDGDACDTLLDSGADILAVMGATPETVVSCARRRAEAERLSGKYGIAYVYAGAGEGESGTDAVYGGHAIVAYRGRILAEKAPFEKGSLAVAPTDGACLYDSPCKEPCTEAALRRLPFVPSDKDECDARCETILTIQSRGLAGRMTRACAKTAVLGLSGGLDSTLAILVAVRAFDHLGIDRKNIIAVTMPGFGTTKRTKGNAEMLADALGVTLRTVSISAAVRQHFSDIGHDEGDHSVVYENAQARERTQILMDIANGENGLVIGTGDLSELALGWATYNGDHMSNYAVNAGVPKTLIRYIVDYAARCADKKIGDVLRDILDTPVSPELLPPKDGEIAQCTEKVVGPYELHDFFLYYTVRDRMQPKAIFAAACELFRDEYDKKTVLSWQKVFTRRFFSQQFKRSCLPDGPSVGSVSLSPRAAFAMPSDASSAVWLRELDEVTL